MRKQSKKSINQCYYIFNTTLKVLRMVQYRKTHNTLHLLNSRYLDRVDTLVKHE